MTVAAKTFQPTVQWDASVLQYFTAAFGAAGLEELSEALCRPPLSNSFRINVRKATREVRQTTVLAIHA